MTWLFSPPIAFLIYVLLVGILSGMGRLMAGPANPDPVKSSTYASGEDAPSYLAAPGYRPFFKVALFFAILHLGALVLATGNFSGVMVIYLVGLLFALIALLLG